MNPAIPAMDSARRTLEHAHLLSSGNAPSNVSKTDGKFGLPEPNDNGKSRVEDSTP